MGNCCNIANEQKFKEELKCEQIVAKGQEQQKVNAYLEEECYEDEYEQEIVKETKQDL